MRRRRRAVPSCEARDPRLELAFGAKAHALLFVPEVRSRLVTRGLCRRFEPTCIRFEQAGFVLAKFSSRWQGRPHAASQLGIS